MAAFAQPGAGQDGWWQALAPMLSANARTTYRYVQTRNITVSKLTGTGRLLPSDSAYLARVRIPTDNGRWTVLLARAGAGKAWQVEEFTPPAGVK